MRWFPGRPVTSSERDDGPGCKSDARGVSCDQGVRICRLHMVLTSYLIHMGLHFLYMTKFMSYMGRLASTCLSLLMSMSILSVGEVNTSHTTPMICSLLCSSIVLLLVGASVRWLVAWFACFLVCLLDFLVLVCVDLLVGFLQENQCSDDQKMQLSISQSQDSPSICSTIAGH